MSPDRRLLIRGVDGWFVAELHAEFSATGLPFTGVSFYTHRPPIYLKDLVVGVRVNGVPSYVGENLLMHVFGLWRSRWLERGDLLVVQPELLALLSNQSAVPGEPDIKLLTLVHPGADPNAAIQVRGGLEHLLQGRRVFGLGLGRYRFDFLQSLGVESLPLSTRYGPLDPMTMQGRLALDYPEALLCLESHRQVHSSRADPVKQVR